jgi:hypothetical protein
MQTSTCARRRSIVEKPDVPDEVRTKLLDDIERRHEAEIDVAK